ncbi:MAG: hypothetical protein KJ709_03830 [Nanoarchaeota archaeon]|nr:hypothetical protein [Nanoarchaeota archaeon]
MPFVEVRGLGGSNKEKMDYLREHSDSLRMHGRSVLEDKSKPPVYPDLILRLFEKDIPRKYEGVLIYESSQLLSDNYPFLMVAIDSGMIELLSMELISRIRWPYSSDSHYTPHKRHEYVGNNGIIGVAYDCRYHIQELLRLYTDFSRTRIMPMEGIASGHPADAHVGLDLLALCVESAKFKTKNTVKNVGKDSSRILQPNQDQGIFD